MSLLGLTVHQPWAWAIAAGHKPLENRKWKPPADVLGKYLAIHASIAGERVQLTSREAKWFQGPYGWVLTDVVAIEPVKCRGNQKLWPVPTAELDLVRARYAQARAAMRRVG